MKKHLYCSFFSIMIYSLPKVFYLMNIAKQVVYQLVLKIVQENSDLFVDSEDKEYFKY